MKKAVMYGAGNIGRGFIGKVFYESGYQVVFVDVVQEVVDKLNIDGEYPVKLVSNDSTQEVIVKSVSAVNGANQSAVAAVILDADIMATAVGVNILPRIADNIASGLDARAQAGKGPLDIIICENLIDADKFLRSLLVTKVRPESLDYLNSGVGLVEASIGRMVPVMTDEMRGDNLLRVVVEPYEELPVDKDAFKGDIPKLRNLVPFSPFGFYIRRKLFVHNMGHALCAYYGWQKGYTYVYESVTDEQIANNAKQAMLDVALALSQEYAIPYTELVDHVIDLLNRFANRVLKDTNARVGGDPIRKLKNTDRLVGAALYCIQNGQSAAGIIPGIAAGYRFNNPSDAAANEIQQCIINNGIEETVKKYSGIDGELLSAVVRAYNEVN